MLDMRNSISRPSLGTTTLTVKILMIVLHGSVVGLHAYEDPTWCGRAFDSSET